MVLHPAEYRWSSYRAHAEGESQPLLTPHETYLRLGRGVSARQRAYRELFRHALAPGLIDSIREATNGNYALGSSQFSAQIAQSLGRRVSKGKAGRPRRSSPVEASLHS